MQVSGNKQLGQRGAVLIIAMVLLLVMSLIGLSSVVSSTLQEKMASNSQQRALSRYAAETALRAAEAYITSTITATSKLSKFNGTQGLYAAYPVPGILFKNDLKKLEATFIPSSKSISEPASWASANSVEVTDLSAKVAGVEPRYVIEYVGRRSQGGTPVWSPSGPIERGAPHIFKITAIGWARDTNVYSVLQSHFMTGQGPGVFEYEE
jgi:type IV pilus assembly protein PilX